MRCRGQRAASTKQALQSAAGSRRDGCASRALRAGFALYGSVNTCSRLAAPGPYGVARQGWFEGTFSFIKYEGDLISKIRARLKVHNRELYKSLAGECAQRNAAPDREVFPTKTS